MPQRTASCPTAWAVPLSEPIHLKDGTTLATLGDAGMFIADFTNPGMGWNAAGAALFVAFEKPTPENIEKATERTKSALSSGRVLKG